MRDGNRQKIKAVHYGRRMVNMSVTIYSSPKCIYCTMAKKYLESKNVQYTEVDVSTDMEASAEIVRRSGQRSIPVIDIDGALIVGFDKDKIDSML